MQEVSNTPTTEESSGDFYNDMHADIEAAFRKLEEQEAREASEATPEVSDEPQVEQESKEENVSHALQQEEETEETQEVVESEEVQSQIEPPQFFKKEFRERWSELTPEWQEYLAQYERQARDDYQRKTRELADERRKDQGVFSALEPYRQEWAIQGITPEQKVSQLLALEQYLSASPRETLKYLADQYGVDLNQVEDNGYTDPRVRQLEQKVSAFEQAQLQAQQLQHHQMMNGLQKEIESFEGAKDNSGKLLHPHFQEVRALMQPYVEAEWRTKPHLTPQQILKQAYEQAVWAHQPTREKLLSHREQATKKQETKSKAATARQRGSSINGAPGSSRLPSPTFEADSVADAVEAAWKQLHGGI